MIVSWTLAGARALDIIGDALRSVVGLVDARLVIDTIPNSTRFPHLAASVPPTSAVSWPWQGSFAAARNAGLDFTAGAAWSVMLDDDERVRCPAPGALRAWLSTLGPEVEIVRVQAVDESHTRERFFRGELRFKGRTHEQIRAPSAAASVLAPPDLVQWSELPKTTGDLVAKFERDVALLRLDIADDPNDEAPRLYLGTALQGLGRWAEAIDAFRGAVAVGSDECAAWACFRAGECYLEVGQPDRALDAAIAGMARDAGIAELPWLASIASLHVGRLEQARCWALMAKTHGKGTEAERRRVGFRLIKGLTVGPDEVLEAARAALP